jgi:hypothetical protein
MRSPIFYDSNDTGYYADPAGNSQFSLIYANNWFRPQGQTGVYSPSYGIHFWSQSTTDWSMSFAGNTSGGLHLWQDHQSTTKLHLYYDTNGSGLLTNTGNWGVRQNYGGGASPGGTLYGSWTSNGDHRAPIFYDSDDTGYYVNPNSTTNLYQLYVRAGGAYTNLTDVGASTAPVYIVETGTGTGSERWIPMIGGTSTSPSGYRQHTVFGSVRGTAWGAAFIGVGGNDSYPTVAYRFDYVGDATAPSSWRAPIFYDSNDTSYYVDPASTSELAYLSNGTKARAGMNIHHSNRQGQTSDTNYWVGTQGWVTSPGWNAAFTQLGSCFMDFWGGDTGHPQGSVHAQGLQALHYRNGSAAYGFQLVSGGDTNPRMWTRKAWGGGGGTWYELALRNYNVGGDFYASIYYDSDDTAYYVNPNGTARLSTVNATVLRSYQNIYTDDNYGYGHVGVYTSTVFQGVFAMGDAYKLSPGGAVNAPIIFAGSLAINSVCSTL